MMSIRSKMIFLIAPAFFVLFTVFIIYVVSDLSISRGKELKQKIEYTSSQIALTTTIGLYNYDKISIDTIVGSFFQDIDISEIQILEASGAEFSLMKRDEKGKIFEKITDITYNSDVIGKAIIKFNNRSLSMARSKTIIQFMLSGLFMFGILVGALYFITGQITLPIAELTSVADKIATGDTGVSANENSPIEEVSRLAHTFNVMTDELKKKAIIMEEKNGYLNEIITKTKMNVVNLNSSSKEIEAAAQEQTSASNEHASGITQVSATIEELSITAKQITKNVGELVFSSEEVIRLLKESEEQLELTTTQLKDVGLISSNNAQGINDLGKRSAIINEMVEIIKEVANKTNILSINASIEASRSGESGAGFSVVAAEIRELSKETIASAKNAEKAAKEIQDFLNAVIISTENESLKVNESGVIVNKINKNIEEIVGKINNNYTFTQKIDLSIKQQEAGSKQAAETMKQLSEISRQSAETARQTLVAVKDIVKLSLEMDELISSN